MLPSLRRKGCGHNRDKGTFTCAFLADEGKGFKYLYGNVQGGFTLTACDSGLAALALQHLLRQLIQRRSCAGTDSAITDRTCRGYVVLDLKCLDGLERGWTESAVAIDFLWKETLLL